MDKLRPCRTEKTMHGSMSWCAKWAAGLIATSWAGLCLRKREEKPGREREERPAFVLKLFLLSYKLFCKSG